MWTKGLNCVTNHFRVCIMDVDGWWAFSLSYKQTQSIGDDDDDDDCPRQRCLWIKFVYKIVTQDILATPERDENGMDSLTNK